ALFFQGGRAVGRRAALRAYRALCLSPRRPGALCEPAARDPRTARAARAIAGARSRHADFGEPDRPGAARRPGRYRGRPRTGPEVDAGKMTKTAERTHPAATLASLRTVRRHVHALSQCRKLIRELRLTPIVAADTAGSAAEIKERGDPSVAAIASELAGQIYGLVSLKENIEDAEHNTTRFLIMSREPTRPPPGTPTVTTFLFRVRNVPAALYKAMGGFATSGIHTTK